MTQTTAALAKGTRADQLQFLRFLAFGNVFIAHAEVWKFFPYPASHCAVFAVSFFFMLSGLVVGYSGFGKSLPPTVGNVARDFWKRIRKIYPLYFLTQVVMILFSNVPAMVLAGDWAGVRTFAVGFAKGLLLLQTWPGANAISLNGASWFLSALVFLSLWNLPVLWFAGKLKKCRWRFVWYVLSFFLMMVCSVVYCYLTQNTDMETWQYNFPPARLGEYIGGILLGYAIRDYKSGKPWIRLPTVVYTLAEIGVLVFWAFSLRRGGNYWMNRIVSWLIPNTFLLAVFTLGEGGISRIFRAKPLVWLGDISFECYLVHHMIILRHVLNTPAETMTVAYQVFSFTYCMLLTILIAAMLHKKKK